MEEHIRRKPWKTVLGITLVAVLVIGVFLFIVRPWEKILNPNEREYFDLTKMSATTIYAQVNDIVNKKPEAYIGKTIKTRGKFNTEYSEEIGRNCNYIFIEDAAKCCRKGIEIVFEGELPKLNAVIQVEGKFEKYQIGGKTYYFLNVMSLNTFK